MFMVNAMVLRFHNIASVMILATLLYMLVPGWSRFTVICSSYIGEGRHNIMTTDDSTMKDTFRYTFSFLWRDVFSGNFCIAFLAAYTIAVLKASRHVRGTRYTRIRLRALTKMKNRTGGFEVSESWQVWARSELDTAQMLRVEHKAAIRKPTAAAYFL